MKKNNKKLLKVTLSTVLCLVCMVTKHTTAMTEEELLGLGLSEGGTEMLRILPRIKQLSEKIKQFEQQSYQVAKQNPLSRIVALGEAHEKQALKRREKVEKQIQQMYQQMDYQKNQHRKLILLRHNLEVKQVQLIRVTKGLKGNSWLLWTPQDTQKMRRLRHSSEREVNKMEQQLLIGLQQQKAQTIDKWLNTLDQMNKQALQYRNGIIGRLNRTEQQNLFRQRRQLLLLEQQKLNLQVERLWLQIKLKKL